MNFWPIVLLHSTMIGYWHPSVIVCLSAFRRNAVHCDVQGRCRGLKVVPACS